MQTVTTQPKTARGTRRQPAAGASFGGWPAGARGRQPPPRRPARAPRPGRGRPDLHHGRHRLGRDPDRSVVRRARSSSSPTRWPATTGSRDSELESERVHARALVVHPAGRAARRGRAARSTSCSSRRGIPAISGIDTRALTLRAAPRRRAPGGDRPGPDRRRGEAVAARRRREPAWEAVDHVAGGGDARAVHRRAGRGAARARATLVDYGVKRSLLAALADRGLEIRVLPPDATAADVAADAPDLVVLSPGPGDPARMAPQIATVARAGRTAPSPAARRSSASASATSCWRSRRAPRRGAWRSATTAATTPCSRRRPGASTSAPTTTRSRSSTGRRSPRPATGSATATSTTARSRGWSHASGRIASVQFHPEGAPGPIDAARVFDLAVERALA